MVLMQWFSNRGSQEISKSFTEWFKIKKSIKSVYLCLKRPKTRSFVIIIPEINKLTHYKESVLKNHHSLSPQTRLHLIHNYPLPCHILKQLFSWSFRHIITCHSEIMTTDLRFFPLSYHRCQLLLWAHVKWITLYGSLNVHSLRKTAACTLTGGLIEGQ